MKQIITDIEMNANEFIRIELSEFKGHNLLSMKVYVDRDGSNSLPTKKGLTVKQTLILNLIEALQKAKIEIDEIVHQTSNRGGAEL